MNLTGSSSQHPPQSWVSTGSYSSHPVLSEMSVSQHGGVNKSISGTATGLLYLWSLTPPSSRCSYSISDDVITDWAILKQTHGHPAHCSDSSSFMGLSHASHEICGTQDGKCIFETLQLISGDCQDLWRNQGATQRINLHRQIHLEDLVQVTIILNQNPRWNKTFPFQT